MSSTGYEREDGGRESWKVDQGPAGRARYAIPAGFILMSALPKQDFVYPPVARCATGHTQTGVCRVMKRDHEAVLLEARRTTSEAFGILRTRD